MPRFSIITPLYNKDRYFPETIQSVLAQDVADWEWIIVDDGSTDAGFRQAQEVAAGEPRVRVETQVNAGPCSARNRGIDLARGEWLLFLDADDLLEPECLTGWQAAIEFAPQVDVHAGAWHEIGPERTEVIATHQPPGLGKASPELLLRETAIAFAPWHPASAVVRRTCVSGYCRWPEEMNRMVTEDTVFWWRLIARHQVAIQNHCGVRYRRGTQGCRDQFGDPVKWSQGLFHALEANVNDWKALGNSLSAGQVTNLVRVYEAFGLEAQQASASEIAQEAYRRADELLSLGIWNGCQSAVRRLLGTRRFQQLRSLL